MIYPDETIDALCDAWDNGLDYEVIRGVVFAMFNDGIWTVGDAVVIDESSKVDFVYKPSTVWGCNTE